MARLRFRAAYSYQEEPPYILGDNWRRYLLDQTIGQNQLLESIVEYFRQNPDVGFMYPENYPMIRHFTEEERNIKN